MKQWFLVLAAVSLVFGAPVFAQDSDEESGGESSEDVKSKVEAMEEGMLEMRSTVDALKKLKISGYIQAQFQMADTLGNGLFPIGGFSGGAFSPGMDNRFTV